MNKTIYYGDDTYIKVSLYLPDNNLALPTVYINNTVFNGIEDLRELIEILDVVRKDMVAFLKNDYLNNPDVPRYEG